MGPSEYDRTLIIISKKFKSHKVKRVLVNFPQKRCKTILDNFLKRINENYDGSRREWYSGMTRTAHLAANVCNVIDLIFGQKRTTIQQTTQLKHLRLYTAACIPQPVNGVDKLKQRLIKVLAGCVQQTVVDEATGERTRSFWVGSRVK